MLEKENDERGREVYTPVVYGNFLLAKVGNNFAGGKGKYD
jgi:hypothetical protein